MADQNQTVSISYRADLKDLLNNLKKIPGLTKEEAQKMVKALDRQLKQAEKSAKKAGKNTSKAMDQISASTKRASFNARALRKDFANIDRLSSEASQALSILSPELGQSAMQVSVLASAMESLGRVFFISNPLFLAAAAAAGLVYFAMDSQETKTKELREATEKFNKGIEESKERLFELEKQLINIEKAFGDFQTILNDTTNDINLMTGAIEESQIEELKIFEQAQKQAVALIEAEEEVSENLRKQRDEKKEQIKLLSEEVQRTRETGKRGREYSKVLTYRKELEELIAEKQEEVLSITREIGKSQDRITEGFQEEADELEKILLQKREEELRQERIKEAQKRTTERLREYQKVLKDIMEPLRDVDKLLKQQAKAQDNANKQLEGAISQGRKLQIEALKDQISEIDIRIKKEKDSSKISESLLFIEKQRQATLEKNNLLLEMENIQKTQIEAKTKKELEAIENQISNVKSRREEEERVLQTMREQLETELVTAENLRNKRERTEKIKSINEKILELSEREQEFKSTEQRDLETLISLEELKSQTQQNGIQELEQATIELHELEKTNLQETIELRKKAIGQIGDQFLKVFGDINSQVQKIVSSNVGMLENEIELMTRERDKQIKSIEQAEQDGLMTSEQVAKRKKEIERDYANSVKDEQLAIYKTNQNQQIAQATIDAVSASIRAFKDYRFPASLAISGLAFAAATKQIQMIKSQPPPEKFDVGGMIGNRDALSPDQRNINVLSGEAVLDRQTVRNLGGESGIRNLQNGGTGSQVVIIQPFRHFDRFVRTASRNGVLGSKINQTY